MKLFPRQVEMILELIDQVNNGIWIGNLCDISLLKQMIS